MLTISTEASAAAVSVPSADTVVTSTVQVCPRSVTSAGITDCPFQAACASPSSDQTMLHDGASVTTCRKSTSFVPGEVGEIATAGTAVPSAPSQSWSMSSPTGSLASGWMSGSAGSQSCRSSQPSSSKSNR